MPMSDSNFGTPGQCSRCSAPILWTRSEMDPGRWNRPLDMASAVKRFVVFNGQLIYADTYVNHLCSNTEPTPVEHVQQAIGERELTPNEEREAWLSVVCPVKDCKAEVGKPCINIRHLYRGDGEIQEYWPHVARRIAGLEGLMDRSPTSQSEYRRMLEHSQRRIQDEIARGKRDKKLDEQRDEANKKIIDKTKCPRCNASRGIRCWNLTQRNKGVKVHTGNPHIERRDLYSKRWMKEASS